MTLALKGLQDAVSVSCVDPSMSDAGPTYVGWRFTDAYPDPLHADGSVTNTYDLYRRTDADYPRRKLSVPILWDKKTDTMVNNESSQIIVMLNSEFNAWAKRPEVDLAPEELAEAMAKIDELVSPNINEGVYRCGFAKSQEAYDSAVTALFDAMDKVEAILGETRYLTGDRVTLSDVRLFTSLARFDSVYYGHFKCSVRRLTDYANMWAYARELYQMPGVKETVDIDHIKLSYYYSHSWLNPTRVVPKGPMLEFEAPHGRDDK